MTFKRENPRHVCVTQVITAWSRVTCSALSEADLEAGGERRGAPDHDCRVEKGNILFKSNLSLKIIFHRCETKTAILQIMTLVCELLVLVSIYKPGPSTNIISDRGVNV